MALVKKQNNNARIAVIAVVVVVAGAIGYFLFQQLYLKNSGTAGTPTAGTGHPVITNFGEAVLNDSRFTQLRPFGTNVNVDVNRDTGQPQPFQ